MTLRHHLLLPAMTGLALNAFSFQALADATEQGVAETTPSDLTAVAPSAVTSAAPATADPSKAAAAETPSNSAVTSSEQNAVSESKESPKVSRENLIPRMTVIGLALDPASEKVTAQLVRKAQDIANESARFVISATRDLLDPEGAKTAKENIRKARKLVESAKANYDELELEAAKQEANDALSLLTDTDMSEDFGIYIAAKKILIAALLADSENNAATALLRDLLPQDPSSAFDPNIFPPDYIAQVNRIRSELKATASGALDLKTTPAADVYVDGIYRGVSPVELRELTKGEHLLTLVAPGYKVLQKKFSSGAAETLSEKLTPVKKGFIYTPFLKALKGKFNSSARAKPAQDLAKFLGVEQMTIVAVKNTSLHKYMVTVVRFDASDGHEYANSEFVLNGDGRASLETSEQAMIPLFALDLPRGKSGQAVQAKVNPFKWKERHTGYLLFGVAAAALGSGVTFSLDAKNQADTFKSLTVPQNSPVYDRIETVGKRSALVADISYGVAIAAAISGAILVIHDVVSNASPSAMDAGRDHDAEDMPSKKSTALSATGDTRGISNSSNTGNNEKYANDSANSKESSFSSFEPNDADDDKDHVESIRSTDGWGEDW